MGHVTTYSLLGYSKQYVHGPGACTQISSRQRVDCYVGFASINGLSLTTERVLSWEVSEAMRKGRISKSAMAQRMGTSRSQLERLLDPENPHVLLETVQKAATAVGKRLTIGLTDAPRAA